MKRSQDALFFPMRGVLSGKRERERGVLSSPLTVPDARAVVNIIIVNHGVNCVIEGIVVGKSTVSVTTIPGCEWSRGCGKELPR